MAPPALGPAYGAAPWLTSSPQLLPATGLAASTRAILLLGLAGAATPGLHLVPPPRLPLAQRRRLPSSALHPARPDLTAWPAPAPPPACDGPARLSALLSRPLFPSPVQRRARTGLPLRFHGASALPWRVGVATRQRASPGNCPGWRDAGSAAVHDQQKVQKSNRRPQEMEGAGPPTELRAPHPAVAPLAFLLGKWCGEGEGAFPTIAPFSYGEELLFSHHPSKPVISYTQRTWKAASGEPMHSESGYWRPRPDGSVEVVIAQSTGLAEVQKGSYDAENKTVTLQSELVGNASKVKQITRAFQVVDGELSYIVQMATISTSLQPHLKALLKKI